jgi:phosphoglycerate dehydrogenase-like enzyme
MADPALLVPHDVQQETGDELVEALAETDVPEAVVTRARTPDETAAALPDAAGLLTFAVDAERLSAAANLRWVQALSAGVNHLDHDALRERDVVLTNAAGVHARNMAEQVIGSLIAFERGLLRAVRQQEAHVWRKFPAGEIAGRTLGILGVGAIGGKVAELGRAFDATVVGTKRDTSTVPEAVDELYGADDHFEVIRRADYLVVACPLTEETRGLVGEDELRVLDRDAILVNVARGPVVDEEALVATLRRGELRGAALDVFEEEPLPADSPLWDLDNVLVTPHNAGYTPHWPERVAAVIEANYDALRGTGEWENRVL